MANKGLPYTHYYETMYPREAIMSKNANELVEAIVEKRAKAEMKSYEGLKKKILDATTKMVTEMDFSVEVELLESDMLALSRVTEALRDLDYKFRFIEIQNSSGETLKQKLLISVAHLA